MKTKGNIKHKIGSLYNYQFCNVDCYFNIIQAIITEEKEFLTQALSL